ncbi:MAG: TolC family protein [Armatimonadota bacterium]|nr:TolC family protein [Armatimonadota bacterium]
MVIRRPFRWVAMMLLCCTLLITTVAAEELSLNQAVELALKNNPTIAADQLSADAAKHAARGARALTNPEISVAPSIIGDAGADSAVLFSQPLELNGSRRVRGRIALNEAAAAGFDAASTRRDIVLRVNQSYWDVARAQEFVKLNQENIAYLESLNAAVQKQLDVGTVPGSQLIKTEVELAGARQELAQAKLELAQAKASMNALLNRPMDTDFAATGPLIFSDVTLDRNAILASALTSRPEVSAATAQVAAARTEIRAAKLRRAPDLAIQARKETFDPGSDGGLALALLLPVLDWGSIKSDVKRAESAARSQEKQLEAVKNSVSLDVEQSIQLVNTSSQVVREYQGGILEKSEELADMARIGYEKGATGYLEVLEAQRTLRSAKTAYYSALANHAKSIAQLEWASGAANAGITEVRK